MGISKCWQRPWEHQVQQQLNSGAAGGSKGRPLAGLAWTGRGAPGCPDVSQLRWLRGLPPEKGASLLGSASSGAREGAARALGSRGDRVETSVPLCGQPRGTEAMCAVKRRRHQVATMSCALEPHLHGGLLVLVTVCPHCHRGPPWQVHGQRCLRKSAAICLVLRGWRGIVGRTKWRREYRDGVWHSWSSLTLSPALPSVRVRPGRPRWPRSLGRGWNTQAAVPCPAELLEGDRKGLEAVSAQRMVLPEEA